MNLNMKMETGITRRTFVRQMGTVAAVAAMPGTARVSLGAAGDPSGQKTLVGSNIYGWSQYAEREKRKLDVEEVISSLRDAGYNYLESWMNLDQPDENARFADQLSAKGLQPVSLYTGARLHEADKASEAVARILATAKVCQKAGFQVISCNPDPIGREKTDEELKTQVSALSELGAGLVKLGMRLGVHHHMPEMANHAREFHYNFEHTKSEDVGFCYDVHWVWKGGVEPADALRAYGNRVVTWHLRQSRDRIWWETVDAGDVDYVWVAQYAQEHQLPRRFTVELALEGGTKVTRTVAENHRLSREYVRKVFGA
jgi:inosose dehydratase